VPETIGGSADLTGSNNTRSKDMKVVAPGNFSGRFVHWGVREHGMASAMNGIALHGGLIPYSGTFLVFSDYCRPAIRLAALMGTRVIHVMTHDSIGLGEDGPTHQPVEHLAALRAIPNLNVFRPCDAMEVAECWELALRDRDRPSILALTRQNLPALRTEYSDANLSARGAYIINEAGGRPDVTIFATGSEVEIAIAAAGLIARERYGVRVVSVPCFELFESQSEEYKKEILDTAPVKVAIEAAVRMGWDRFIGNDGIFVGMEGFGASAPYEKLYEHFGITARRAADLALARLRANA
jgi:transketolase